MRERRCLTLSIFAIVSSSFFGVGMESSALSADPSSNVQIDSVGSTVKSTDPLELSMWGHTNYVTGVALSEDGNTAITVGVDKSIRIWDIAAGRAKHVLKSTQEKWVHAVAITPDEKEFITVEQARVAAYDIATGEETWNYETSEEGNSGAVRFDRAGHFACIGSSYEVNLWDNSRRQDAPRRIIPQRDQDGVVLSACALSPDGKQLALSTNIEYGASSQIELWDVDANEILRTIIPEKGSVRYLNFTADGTRLLSSGHSVTRGSNYSRNIASPNNEDSLILYDVSTGDIIRKFGCTVPVKDRPSQKVPVDGVVTPSIVAAPPSHTRNVFCTCLSPDEKRLFTAERDGMMRIYDFETGEVLKELRRHTDDVMSLAISSDGTRLVSVSLDMAVMVWDLTVIPDQSE